jgi:phospholipid N-methyltransferase
MVMKNCRFKRNGTVLELMAGCGRNMELLMPHFSKVEMLERNISMTKAIKNLSNKPSVVYEQDVRDFRWDLKLQSYDCIFCVWGLGYLSRADNLHMLAGITRAIKPNGFIIFFESVLPFGVTEDRFHDTLQQQNVVRRLGYYNELFTQAGLSVFEEKRYGAWDDGENGSEEYASYVLKLN